MASLISNPTTPRPSISSLSSPQKPKPTTSFPCSSFFNPISLSPSRFHQPKPTFPLSPSTPRSTITCGGVTLIDQDQFTDTVLKSQVPVLVEFIADWCGPCRLIAPAMEWASQEYKDRLKVVKIDHDANPQLIEEYKIYGLPGLIMFNNGVEVRGTRREGAMTKVKLKEYLDAALESISVA